MSHQTGIKASEDLAKFFASAKDGSVRSMKIIIKDEQLELGESKPPNGSYEDDYDDCVLPFLVDKEPSYVLFRMDSKNNQGYQWLFIAYSPDFAKVRDKMMYAGTRATLKMEFGNGHINDEIFATAPADATLDGYRKHIESKNADKPLSFAEMELEEIKRKEQQHHGVSTKHATLPGINFPVDDDALAKLEQIKAKEISYVQLQIDIEKEEILLAKAEDDLAVENLKTCVPTDRPRYHLYVFKHTHEGDYMESIVFVYSMPGYSVSVKERMLYSSCKASLVALCEQYLDMTIDKKVEISDGGELTEEYLQDELHPKKILHRPKFSKPKPPPGRGAKRITKPNDGEGKSED